MDLISFAQNYFPFILGAHLVGVVLGFGGALISDILFFKFLKDFKITNNEASILHALSKVIWFGIGVIVLSGFFLFLSDIERYSMSSKFLTKMSVVAIIIINGIVLNFVVTPKLTSIAFGELKGSAIRRIAFACGAVSITSWWAAFILGLMKTSPAPLHVMFSTYLFILAGAIIGSQILEKLISARKIQPPAV